MEKENNLTAILRRQQELEYLKEQNCPSFKKLNALRKKTPSAYSRTVLGQCLHIYSQISMRKFWSFLRKIPLYLLGAFAMYMILGTIFYLIFPNDSSSQTSSAQTSTEIDDFEEYVSQMPIIQLQYAIEDEDFELARSIIKENNFKPDTFCTASYFSDLYVHDKDYDQAADVLVNFITNIYGTQNVLECSPLYVQLQEVSKLELSPEARQRCTTCLNACKESAARLASISALIDTEKYDLALELCDAQHRTGTCYYILFEYYNTCYTKLKRYEDYADFLMTVAKEVQQEEDEVSYFLPDDSWVQSCLEKVYPHVSKSTQERIDAMHFFE